MKLLYSVYFHARCGFPEAVTAGIIAFDLAEFCNLTNDDVDIAKTLASAGLLDEASFQLGFIREDADLVRGSEDGDDFYCIVSN